MATAEIRKGMSPQWEPAGGYFPIGLGCLFPEAVAPCDLFRRVGPGEWVLFAGKGIPFDLESKKGLQANGVDHLFIREAEASLYFSYIRETLTCLVKNPTVTPEIKAEAVHSSCRETLRWVFDDPRASFIASAQQILTPTVDLIVSSDQAVRHLIRLTAYDHCTYIHSTNVGIFGIALARILFGTSADHDMQRLGAGFFLHDLGKCRIPLSILNKPGPLDPEERQIVNRHPEDGYRMLEESGLMTEEARIVILQHHERDDGRGYPQGVTAKDIHPYARICRIVDVYEALTAQRPYHQPKTTFEALKLMKQKIFTDIDQKLLDHFLRLFLS